MLKMEVMPDHVHLLLDVDPQFGIHHLVKLIKGRSFRIIVYSKKVQVSWVMRNVYDSLELKDRFFENSY